MKLRNNVFWFISGVIAAYTVPMIPNYIFFLLFLVFVVALFIGLLFKRIDNDDDVFF